MPTAYSADKIFTGKEWRNNAAVIIKNNFIADVVSLNDLPTDVTAVQHAPMLTPAFIDIQIYGASSKLFSAYPSSDTLSAVSRHLAAALTSENQ